MGSEGGEGGHKGPENLEGKEASETQSKIKGVAVSYQLMFNMRFENASGVWKC